MAIERTQIGQSPIVDNSPNLMATRDIGMMDGVFASQMRVGQGIANLGQATGQLASTMKQQKDEADITDLQLMEMNKRAEIFSKIQSPEFYEKPEKINEYYNSEMAKLRNSNSYQQKFNDMGKSYKETWITSQKFLTVEDNITLDKMKNLRIVEMNIAGKEKIVNQYIEQGAPLHMVVETINRMPIYQDQKDQKIKTAGKLYAERYYSQVLNPLFDNDEVTIADLQAAKEVYLPDFRNSEEYDEYKEMVTQEGYPAVFTSSGEMVFYDLSLEEKQRYRNEIDKEIQFKQNRAAARGYQTFYVEQAGQLRPDVNVENILDEDAYAQYEKAKQQFNDLKTRPLEFLMIDDAEVANEVSQVAKEAEITDKKLEALTELKANMLTKDTQANINDLMKSGYSREEATTIVKDPEIQSTAFEMVKEQARELDGELIKYAALQNLTDEYQWPLFPGTPYLQEGGGSVFVISDYEDLRNSAGYEDASSPAARLHAIAVGFQGYIETAVGKQDVYYTDVDVEELPDGTKINVPVLKKKTSRSLREINSIYRKDGSKVLWSELLDSDGNPIKTMEIKLGFIDDKLSTNVIENGVLPLMNDIRDTILAFKNNPKINDGDYLDVTIKNILKDANEKMSEFKGDDAKQIKVLQKLRTDFNEQSVIRFVKGKRYGVSR